MDRNRGIQTLLQDIAQDAAPAATIALGQGVRERALHMRIEQDRFHRRGRLALAALAGLALIAGLLIAVPTTRAAIDSLLKRLGIDLAPREETDRAMVGLAVPTILPVTQVPRSIAEIQAQTPFTLRTPSWLPDGLRYQTGDPIQKGGGDIQEVLLIYRPAGDEQALDSPELMLEVSARNLGPVYLSADAAQDVKVNGQPGVYIHGGWTTNPPLQPGQTAQGLFWDSASDDAYLSWVEDGLAYRIQQHGLGLSLADLTRIAESLR